MYRKGQRVIPYVGKLTDIYHCPICGLDYPDDMLKYNFMDAVIEKINRYIGSDKYENERYFLRITKKNGQVIIPRWSWCRHMLKPKNNYEAVDNDE